MTIFNIFSMLGGLGLFLFGMNMTSNHLEIAAGDKMKMILEKLTSNRFVAVVVGALITALVQSSSAVTVMVVGFVNSGIMHLQNAVWIIMGANIGTTTTGLMVAFKITDYAPLIIFIGIVLYLFMKSKKGQAIGGIFTGIGLIFLGMEMMSSSMAPLREVPEFVSLLTKFQNPIIGILVGALFTAIIQSSAASIGILQALALSNAITLPSAVYVLFGQNIGTCITSLIASIGTNRNAKRVTLIHLSFNVIGTAIFVIISLILPFTDFVQSLTPTNVAAQIANTHLIFNVATTLILIPFGTLLVKLSYKLLPEVEDSSKDNGKKLLYIDNSLIASEYKIGAATIVLSNIFKEIQHMIEVVRDNVDSAFNLVGNYSEEGYQLVEKNEDYVDFLNEKIVEYTVNISSFDISSEGVRAVANFLEIVSNAERVCDNAMNVARSAKTLHESGNAFSTAALEEVDVMRDLCNQLLEEVNVLDVESLSGIIENVDAIETNIGKTNKEFSNSQLQRLRNNECTIEKSIIFSKILGDYEEIGDCCIEIADDFYELRKTLQSININVEN